MEQNRRYNRVQLPEPMDVTSESMRRGNKPLSQLGLHRMHVAAKMLADVERMLLADSNGDVADLAVRVFRLNESNICHLAGVDTKDAEAYAEQFYAFADTIVYSWKPGNVIWEVTLHKGSALTSVIDSRVMNGQIVWHVTDPEREQSFHFCLDDTSPLMRLDRKTLLEIFPCTGCCVTALDNSHQFTSTVGIVNNKLTGQHIEGILYEMHGKWNEMTLFESEIETWFEYVSQSMEQNGATGTHIDDGPLDSEIIEKPFIDALEKWKDVKLYIKHAYWFTVTTPVGNYNHYYAVVMGSSKGSDDLLYLVRETKDTRNLDTPRLDEKHNILYVWKHFRDSLDMGRCGCHFATEASQIPDGCVRCVMQKDTPMWPFPLPRLLNAN